MTGVKIMKREEIQKISYEPPQVISCSMDDLIEQIGPAKACSHSGNYS